MRTMLRILLFPIRFALSVAVLICRVVCGISTTILCLLAFALLLFGAATMMFLQDMESGRRFFLIAWIISPIGVPLIFNFLVELLAAGRDLLREI